MDFQDLLREKNLTMYRLAKISGVPKTTVIDLCTGKSAVEGCTAKTVQNLARALDCTMEELMTVRSAVRTEPGTDRLTPRGAAEAEQRH